MLLTTSPVWAGGGNGNQGKGNDCQGNSCGGNFKAPEIDAASGTSAIALLTGVLLLVGERSRSRRSS
ncbi:VPEID-CTERM sorting domain-containing protein [Methylobacter sp.]|uniref:VPEID-CTERM sorting domain-containing protein n=1 Tax=Methylobacter sp. TaxID=2051955 RepID=UPI00344EE5F6